MRWAPAVAAVAAEICYPLVGGVARQELSAVVVVLFGVAVLVAAERANAVRLLGIVALGSLAVEAFGVRTGVPFGSYAYTGHLGPRLLDVPLVVPLAWTMMAWPALCVGRRIGGRFRVGWAALAMASWDVFLDPQMVHAGAWTWTSRSPALQGIPWSNFAGWLGCSLLLMAVLDRVLAPVDDRVPVALWAWTWLGSTAAFVAFLGLPLAGLIGFAAMGVVGVPLLTAVARSPRPVTVDHAGSGELAGGLRATADTRA